MLRRLKLKIVLLTVIPVMLLISVILVTMSVNGYTASKNDIEMTLSASLEDRMDKHTKPSQPSKPESLTSRIGAYIKVELDADGNILNTYGKDFGLDENALSSAVKKASKSDSTTGILRSEKVMFEKRMINDRLFISFADTSMLENFMYKTILTSVFLWLLSGILMLLIGFILSGIVISPVRDAWERQKQFIADASHELKTPLTVIIANNNILQSHRDSSVEEQLQWIESTAEESLHMKKLIDNMLFLARADEGKERIILTSTSISEIAEKTVLHFEPIAFESGVRLDSRIEEGVTLNSNEVLLSQLLQTLTDNAIKYCEKDGDVFVTLLSLGNTVRFTVTNPGFLTSENIDHIFDRFYRSDSSRSDNGYGLGLAIAKSITDSLGGSISVTSQDGKVTFTLEFKQK
jgi:signal transduction histidine kinase